MSDIDKIYNLLEKVYIELQDTKKEVRNNSHRLDNLETGNKKLESILEHDIKGKLQALHERAGQNTDKLIEYSKRLESIENKMDILAMLINSQDKRLELVESKHKKAK